MKKLSGFSLMEMMVVLLIVALVAAASAPMINKRMVIAASEKSSSPWVRVDANTIAYNLNGSNLQTAMVGTMTSKADADSARFYIESNDSTPQIAFGQKNDQTVIKLLAGNTSVFLTDDINNFNSNHYQTVLGYGAKVSDSANAAVAIGYKANADAAYTTALGLNATASKQSATAIGLNTQATAENSTAIGYSSSASGLSSVALGYKANATASNALSIGYNAVSGANTVAIGYDATGTIEDVVIGKGARSSRTKDQEDKDACGSVVIGREAKAEATDAVAIGSKAEVTAGSGIAIGSTAFRSGESDITPTKAGAAGALAVGDGARALKEGAIAFGTVSRALGNHSISIGQESKASHSNSVALGYQAETIADNQIVLGTKNDTVYIPGNLIVAGHTVLGINGSSHVWLNLSDGGGASSLGIAQLGSYDNIVRSTPEITKDGEYYTYFQAMKLFSDRRLKNVGKVFEGGLAEIKKLEVFNYTFKADESKTPRVGVMAQDLQKIFPNAVTKGEDGFLRIRMEDMFYALVNAVKELSDKFDTHDKQIAELTKQNQELQKTVTTLEKRLVELEKKVNAGK